MNKKHLLVAIDAPISFYVSNNETHEFIEEKIQGVRLVENEFMKYLNSMLKDVESPFEKILVYLKVPALGFNKLPLFIKSKSKVNKPIVFNNYSESFQRKYSVVDITRNDNDPIKVGSFKVTVRLKAE